VNSDCPQHYALNASGKEAINVGSIFASGPIRSFAGKVGTASFHPPQPSRSADGMSVL
jgi:hypothetical protein